jgi:hypothetical protein
LQCFRESNNNDETLPNSIKEKPSKKGREKKQRARTKVQASKQPKRGVPTATCRKGNPIRRSMGLRD